MRNRRGHVTLSQYMFTESIRKYDYRSDVLCGCEIVEKKLTL